MTKKNIAFLISSMELGGAEKATLESHQAKVWQALRTEHESALEAVGKANQEAVEKAESSAKQLHDEELSVRLGQLATTHVAQLEAARQEAAAGAVEATTERASLEKAHTAALDEVSTCLLYTSDAADE